MTAAFHVGEYSHINAQLFSPFVDDEQGGEFF